MTRMWTIVPIGLTTLILPPVFGQNNSINPATGQPIASLFPIAVFTDSGTLQCELQTLVHAVANPPCVRETETGLHVVSDGSNPDDSTPRLAWTGSDCVGRLLEPTYEFSFTDNNNYTLTFFGNRGRDNAFSIQETGTYSAESGELRMDCNVVTGNFPSSPGLINPDPNSNRNCETSTEQQVFFLADSEQLSLIHI